MKVRRNDLCPCGSGKKYKWCCLPKDTELDSEDRLEPPHQERDDQESREPDASDSSEWPDEPLGPEPAAAMSPGGDEPLGPEVTAAMSPGGDEPSEDGPPNEREDQPDPRAQAVNARWEEFAACDYQGRIAVFIRTLDEPELMDGEMVFGMLEMIRQGAEEHDDWDQLEILLRALEERHPETFAESAPYYVSWMIDERVVQGRLEEMAPLALEIARYAGQNIDIFNFTLDRLAYHCRLSTLVDMMRLACSGVKDSTNILPGGVDEFIDLAFRYELLYYCGHASSPRADDPELIRQLESYAGSVNHDFVSVFIESVTGRAQQPLIPGGSRSEWCDRLCLEFLGYLVREEGVSPGKADLASECLRVYLRQRLNRRLKNSPKLYDPGRRPAPRKGKARRTRARAVHVLCPDSRTFDPYLADQLHFFSPRYHTVAATMEMIPAWLRFLESRQLIDAQEHAATLNGLAKLHGDLLELWKKYPDDPALYPAALDAWRELPEVSPKQEAPARPHR